MKKSRELVNILNKQFPDLGKFICDPDGVTNTDYIYLIKGVFRYELVKFHTPDNKWRMGHALHQQSYKVQDTITNFFSIVPRKVVPKKKYHVIIGRDETGDFLTAYQKGSCGFFVQSNLTQADLRNENVKFTESEFRELKSKLPINLKRIVELGKTEVLYEWDKTTTRAYRLFK